MEQEKSADHLGHMNRGHQNAQGTIRSFDTKSSILFAFSSLAIAPLWKLAKYILTFDCCAGWVGCLQKISIALIVIAGTAAFLALWHSLSTISARPLPDNHKLPASILYPYIEKKKRVEQRRYICEKSEGMTKEDINAEYSEQLGALGEILGQKTWHNKIAIICFKALLVCLVLLAGMSIPLLKHSTLFSH